MVMSHAKIEERASVFLDFDTAFIEFFRGLYVTFLEFSSAFL